MSKWYYLFVIVVGITFFQSAWGQDSISYTNKKKIEELKSRIDKLYTMESNCDSITLELKQLLSQQTDSIRLLMRKLNAASENNYSGNSLMGNNSNRIYYGLGKVKANYSAYPMLDSIASLLKNDPSIILKLVGHADKTGPENFNQNLSLLRAEDLKAYLLKKFHLTPDKMITEGHGSEESIKEIADPYLFHLNRRVEVFIEKPQHTELLLSE